MLNIKELISPAINFIEAIKPKDKIVIVHGHDSDSICSAAIVHKLIEKLIKTDANLVISELNSVLTEKTFNKIRKLKPAYTIIVDIPNIDVEVLTKLRNISKVLLIDHHIPRGYVKIVYVNPRVFERESYLPATYLCYKIYEDFFDVKDVTWVAGIGTLADVGMKNCFDLFNKIRAEYRELVDEIEPDDEVLIEKSLLGRLVKFIDSSMVVKNVAGSVFSLKVLLESKGYNDVFKNRTLSTYYNLVEKEFRKAEEDFNKKKEVVGNIILYEIRSKLKIKSNFASYIQRFFDDNIFVIYQKDGNEYDVSLRRGKNLDTDLDESVKEGIRDIKDSSGGGHPQAAGCRIPARQLKKFIENLRIKMELESERS